MKIELMRLMDYWVGIPICFLLSALAHISQIIKFTRKKTEGQAVRKILFIKLSEIGSIILAYPLLKKIKEKYSNSQLFFITFTKNRDVFSVLDNIILPEHILTINDASIGLFILDTLRVIKKLREAKIDVAFDLEFFSRFTAILTYLSNAHKRIGFYNYNFEGLYRGNLLTHNIQYNPLIHISKTYLSLFQTINEEEKFSPELGERIDNEDIILPKFVSTAIEHKQMQDRLREYGVTEGSRLFLINPGEGNLSVREWPLDNFIILSKMILEEDKNNYLIIVGVENHSNKSSLFYQTLDTKRCINFTNKTTLIELLELFKMAEALVVNDCGLAHLASLAELKKFVFFGPESPQVFAPSGQSHIISAGLPCSPCLSVFNHRNTSCIDNLCLKIIKPRDVFLLIKNSYLKNV